MVTRMWDIIKRNTGLTLFKPFATIELSATRRMAFQGEAEDNKAIAADGDAALHEALVRVKMRDQEER